MSEGKLEVRCTHCGYPYPMTRLQAEVFDGRNMGCMACGRPFLVKLRADLPPEREPGDPSDTSTETDNPKGDASLVAADESDRVEHSAAKAAPAAKSVTHAGQAAGRHRSPARIAPAAKLGLGAAMLALVALTAAVVFAYAQMVPGEAHLRPLPTAAVVLMKWIAPACAGVATLAGLVGVWTSIVTVRRDLPDEFRPRAGYAVTALALGASELAMIGVIAIAVWSPLSRGLDASRRAASMQNLQQIGNSALAVARSAGTYPESIEAMVRSGQAPAGVEAVPGTADRYRYLGKSMPLIDEKASPPTSQVLAMEPLNAWSDGGVFVLFADASMVYANRPQAEALARELESGRNPPPSAATLRR